MRQQWNKPYKKIERKGPFVINNQWIGVDLYCNTEGVVIDNVVTKEMEHQVKLMRTENIELLAGESTVAVLRITSRHLSLLNAKVP